MVKSMPTDTRPAPAIPEGALPAEAMRALRMSRNTFWRRVADGTIPVVRIGPRSVRVPVDAIRALLTPTNAAPAR